ncbi:MAG: NADH-quinone oxidoreductase subunit C, partial [Acidobacteria bacterium]|nr:NADH-quinone oxidoreductase subunit C [Acidobacteriota bacterium]
HTPYVQLTHMSAVDWIEDGELQLTYLLTDPKAHVSLMVCTRIGRGDAEAESIHVLWPQAVTYEQEINEMFGIHFPGSPRQGVPFILEGWNDIPPMRRDFDTVAYVDKHHPSRPGREHTDPRAYIGKVFGERGYLHDD